MSTYLGIDLGTKLGWAVATNHEVTTYGLEDYSLKRFEGGGMRFLRFRRTLDDMKTNLGNIDGVFFEEVKARQPSVSADQVYGGLKATLMSWCDENGIPYQGLPVGAIKKHATGKGNASKDEMIFAAEMLGFEPQTDDVADAILLLSLALEEIVPR